MIDLAARYRYVLRIFEIVETVAQLDKFDEHDDVSNLEYNHSLFLCEKKGGL